MTRKKLNQKVASWLESHWVTPSYSGWLLGSLSLFFFVAATNTMAGWLYVISSIGVALLAIAAMLPERSLRGIEVQRRPIDPVSVGEPLTIKLRLKNATAQPKALLQVQDLLPHVLAEPAITAIESLAPYAEHTWIYAQPTQRRGIYRWHTVQLRTAAPLGLFWCRRSRPVRSQGDRLSHGAAPRALSADRPDWPRCQLAVQQRSPIAIRHRGSDAIAATLPLG